MKSFTNNEAVSPVVGVMLMLVVTIIIAAVVSAFAGGISGTADKAPQVQIKGTYSISDGMTIEHIGGSAIGTIDTIVMVRPTKTFGDAEHMIWTINKSTIVNSPTADAGSKNAWMREDGYSGEKNFAAGSTAYINPPYHLDKFLQPGASKYGTYSFNCTANIGKTFWLELADSSGKVFAQSEVTITS
ncbi:type IV pilin N-terminal domain-containing protein [Methanomicrobium antiquum]|uniref:Type IV pilin N-terminal domain-containing protein n=1 Tax=Methanomicrobium antiquum TaxID=487686 RepID=A0AAF0JU68_9EURY|nr:type IV pilin N-terminal domain-containing protein [Methanomicrobium antiquum]WFN37333.1 type IV pilin N-terminal domain-containing protein [Methanomicrobium antiquum]